jgi:hypothetical protein
MPSATDAQKFSNISATTAGFGLSGGRYQVAVVATFGGGSVQLQSLGPDGSTFLPAHTALTANGFATLDLPPGTYRIATATATAVFASVIPVPVRI